MWTEKEDISGSAASSFHCEFDNVLEVQCQISAALF